MSSSDISRISTGTINTVNDAVIGMSAAPLGLGLSKFAGQLGVMLDLASNEVVFDSSVGDVNGGRFQYVQLAAAADVPVLGQILFWDTTVASNLFQVTTDEGLSSDDDSIMIAGINLNPDLTVGYYTWIQILGEVDVKFRATLTDTGAIGSRVYAAAAGGPANGLADVLNNATAATEAIVSYMQGRFLGKAIEQPVGGAVSKVSLFPQMAQF